MARDTWNHAVAVLGRRRRLQASYAQYASRARGGGYDGSRSCHAEERAVAALSRRVPRAQLQRRGFTVFAWRHTADGRVAMSRPCGLCTHHTLRRATATIGVPRSRVWFVYTTRAGWVRRTYARLLADTPFISGRSVR